MGLVADTTSTGESLGILIPWMKNPSHDRDLGHNILSWMRETYQNLL